MRISDIYLRNFFAHAVFVYLFIYFCIKKGKSNIREYIMEMSTLASKLKALKLEFGEDLLVHLVLISLTAHIRQFKVSYNTQKVP